jgi:hypoxanthine-DNA glycosylase
MRAHGFPPLAARSARVLVLGSLPGRESLRRRAYYAQPRNAFWPIMGALFGAGPELAYDARRRRLVAAGVALWDVCASAVRPGSLDADIDAASVVANDFAAFLGAHPGIRAVYFNGQAAAALYRRRVLPALRGPARALPLAVLPSTSPAHAARAFAAKLAAWRVLAAEAALAIGRARSASDWRDAGGLVAAYAHTPGVDRRAAGLDAELADLAGHYGGRRAAFLLARRDGRVVGGVALRPRGAATLELKRLYVVPAARRSGLARRLLLAAVALARARGARRLLLDTLPGMHGALALYGAFGFRPTAAYHPSPFPGTLYLELALEP